MKDANEVEFNLLNWLLTTKYKPNKIDMKDANEKYVQYCLLFDQDEVDQTYDELKKADPANMLAGGLPLLARCYTNEDHFDYDDSEKPSAKKTLRGFIKDEDHIKTEKFLNAYLPASAFSETSQNFGKQILNTKGCEQIAIKEGVFAFVDSAHSNRSNFN